jgi:homospermidine synthase
MRRVRGAATSWKFLIYLSSSTVFRPAGGNKVMVESYGCSFEQIGLTAKNYAAYLTSYFLPHVAHEIGFVVNVSVGVSSRAITEFCISNNIYYLDTVRRRRVVAVTRAHV